MSFNIPRAKKRVVIVGGGFGGLKLADKLRKSDFQVVLVDRSNFHQFPPLIYQVASSGLEPGSISFPFRKLFQRRKHFYFRLAEVQAVYPERNEIETSIGKEKYDYLVLAAGAETNFFGNGQIEQAALPMKSVEEALDLRNALLSHLEQALTASSRKQRDELLNIVIVGGGATGVEIAGALAEMKRFVIPRDYPDLPAGALSIYLIEAGDRLLAGMSPESSAEALRFLQKMEIDVRFGCKVTDYCDHCVVFADGSRIPSRTFIWVSGIRAVKIGNLPETLTGRGGRIRVDRFNRVIGMQNIFAIGDQCIMDTDPGYPGGHPQLAQAAIQQGVHLAENLCRIDRGEAPKPFRYRNLGVMATIGRNRAVAEIGRMKLSGWLAWLIWLTVHLRSILGVRNKIVVLFDWIWSYMTYDQSLRLILRTRRNTDSQQNATDNEKPDRMMKES